MQTRVKVTAICSAVIIVCGTPPPAVADDTESNASASVNVTAVTNLLPSGLPNVSAPILESPDMKMLQAHKWIVKDVQRDGTTNPAQIGQKIGDVIEFTVDDQSLGFG